MTGARIILPGAAQRADRGLTIFVPGKYVEQGARPALRCMVPTGGGEVCGAGFTEDQHELFQRHIGRCAKEHEHIWRAESPKARMPVFDQDLWDPEVAAHMREVGQRMLREGRLTTKPSERAGF